MTEDGKLYMFVAVDRTSKFAYAELHPRATRIIAKDFFDNKIYPVLKELPIARALGTRTAAKNRP